jgi:hypothetical protein
MLARLAHERELMQSVDRHETQLQNDNFFFSLNWISDGDPVSLCARLGFDFESLSQGTASQQRQQRIQLLEKIL